jgi:hypothetical protein
VVRLALVLLAAAMTLSSRPIAFADEVPTYDVNATCRTEAQAVATAGTAATCVTQEQQARKTLVDPWAQFAPLIFA